MGGGVNLMFHIGAAMALVLVVHLALEFKRQRDLIRELLAIRRRGDQRARVYVEAPEAFVARLAKALGIEVDGDAGPGLPPRRIDPKALVELHLELGIEHLRWSDATLEIVSRSATSASSEWQNKLAAALGDGVGIKITGDRS